MLALVLAGGRGLRLSPYTHILPKPLLPVGDRPVLSILLERLRLAGVDRAVLALGYLGELIRAYFGDGNHIGIELSYLSEEESLGTGGPVALLPPQREPFLVVNGDIITDMPFDDLYGAHLRMGASATVAAHLHQIRLEFGRLRVREGLLQAWDEKPVWENLIGIGVYVLSPEAQAICPHERLEMPALIGLLLERRMRVGVYVTRSYWRDIGLPDEYKAVNLDPPDFVKALATL